MILLHNVLRMKERREQAIRVMGLQLEDLRFKERTVGVRAPIIYQRACVQRHHFEYCEVIIRD